MSHVPPHHWLEMKPAGAQAQEVKTLRVEDRELLAAIGSRPSRVLDVFRRLRWTESQAFQDALNRMIIRGWVVALERLEDVPASASDDSDSSGDDPLGALLARYASESGGLDIKSDPAYGFTDGKSDGLAWEDSAGLPASLEPPLDEESSTQEEGFASSEEDDNEPWSRFPPSPPPSAENAEDLMAAMGLSSSDVPRPAPPIAPPPSHPTASDSSAFPSSDGLLKALLRGAPAPDIDPVVDVPAYGMSPPPDSPASPSDDFVRLRDVGATVGPGDGPPSSPSSPNTKARPSPPRNKAVVDSGPMSDRSRRQQAARQSMLDAARREKAQRDELRERAEKMRIQKEVAAEERERNLKHQRAIEEADRGSTFLGRAERARRIRDGLPLNPKDD